MASFGGFYKGEKKKKKKDTKSNTGGAFSDKPVFTLPKMVEKKRREA